MNIPHDMVEGSIHQTKNYGSIRVIRYITAKNVRVEFEDTGEITRTSAKKIREGIVTDKSRGLVNSEFKSGSVHKSNRYGRFEILNYFNYENIEVFFLNTKTKAKTTAAAIRTGNVRDPSVRSKKCQFTGIDSGVLS